MIPAFTRHRASGATDPYWSYVTALLHFDGTNGSTTFTDQIGTAWSANSAVSISTAQYKFGGASGYFNQGYISAASQAGYGMGAGDFTAECWIYPTSFQSSFVGIICCADNSGYWTGIQLAVSSGYLHAETNQGTTSGSRITGSTSISLNTWHHVAMSRSGGTLYLFLDGVLQGSSADSYNVGSAEVGLIGIARLVSSSEQFLGYIDDCRITKGIGRYTANFTPPTAAFPNS